MDTVFIIIEMIGGLVLFLYGMQVMGDALTALSGGRLEKILEKLTSNRVKGVLLGVMVTAIIQSSGATDVMVIGFVNSQIMTLKQAIGVILGANIGTTVTAWLLSLSGIQGTSVFLSFLRPKYFAPILGLIGLLMTMVGKKEKSRQIGNILVGLAVLLIGMNLMSESASPLTENEKFIGLMTAFSNPAIGILVGVLATTILQSSSASIGVMQALAVAGSLTMGSAIPIIMGANIGSATTGLIGSMGASRNGRRTALMQMYFCIIKVCMFMIIFYPLNAIFHFPLMSMMATPVKIAIFHSTFNIIAVAVMTPIADILPWLAMKTMPMTQQEKEEIENRRTLQILDERFLASPAFALDQAKVATERMAHYTTKAVGIATGLIFEYNEDKAKEVDKIERRVDEYNDTLETYLVKLSRNSFTKKDSHTLSTLLHSINDFERITDHALNIMQVTTEMKEKDITFSSKANAELLVLTKAVRECLDRAITAFTNNDMVLAKTVEPLEDVIDGLTLEIKRRHVKRLSNGKCTVEAGFSQSDLITDLERISDHCSNIAVDMLALEEDNFDVHEYLEKEEQEPSFRNAEDDFARRYQLPSKKDDEEEKEDRAGKKIAGRTAAEAIAAVEAEPEGKKKKKKKKQKG